MSAACTSMWGRVRTVRNPDFGSNTYLVPTADDAGCVVVDPGLSRASLEAALADSGWTPRAVVCTHGHFDHVGGTAWLQRAYGIEVHLPEPDLKIARLSNFLLTALKLGHRIELPHFSLVQFAGPGEGAAPAVDCEGLRFTFHPLPGHTPGSCGVMLGKLLFSGDSLYARQTALSRMPGEDHAQLRRSLRGLFAWIAPDVQVLPGHGGSATIAEILEHNVPLREFMAADAEVTP